MHSHTPDRQSPDPDKVSQALVLHHVLEEHPLQLRKSDLVRELETKEEVGKPDSIRRAVQELVRVGLLYCNGPCVLPTPAAARFIELPFP
jgi:hypothetical protein